MKHIKISEIQFQILLITVQFQTRNWLKMKTAVSKNYFMIIRIQYLWFISVWVKATRESKNPDLEPWEGGVLKNTKYKIEPYVKVYKTQNTKIVSMKKLYPGTMLSRTGFRIQNFW